jgi:hypothetical protein
VVGGARAKMLAPCDAQLGVAFLWFAGDNDHANQNPTRHYSPGAPTLTTKESVRTDETAKVA